MVEIIVQHIAALVPQMAFLHLRMDCRLNFGTIQVVTSVSVKKDQYFGDGLRREGCGSYLSMQGGTMTS